jgi:hypothetical protein
LEDFCSSLLGHLNTFLYFPIVLDFRKFLFGHILLCFPGPSETVIGSNFYYIQTYFYSVLPIVPLRQKGGVIFIFGPGMYFQTGQVFLSQNGQRGSLLVLLASFCVWTKTLICTDVVK